MTFDEYSDFDAEPGQVLALFTQRDYFVRKYRNLGASDVEVVDCADDGDHFAITIHLLEPQSKPLPGFIRRIVGNRIAMTRSDAWERSSGEGRLVVEMDSAPVTVGVDMRLEARSPGTRLHLHFDIQAGVPVVAGRVEKFLADDLMARIRADMDESRRLLPHYTQA